MCNNASYHHSLSTSVQSCSISGKGQQPAERSIWMRYLLMLHLPPRGKNRKRSLLVMESLHFCHLHLNCFSEKLLVSISSSSRLYMLAGFFITLLQPPDMVLFLYRRKWLQPILFLLCLVSPPAPF